MDVKWVLGKRVSGIWCSKGVGVGCVVGGRGVGVRCSSDVGIEGWVGNGMGCK